MRTLVLGAGVVGVTAAYYLARAGHQVTVVERRAGPGLETSFANGGQIAANHSEPWANPGTPAKVLKWLGRGDAPILFRPRADPRLWKWVLRFLGNCTSARARINTERLKAAHASRRRSKRGGQKPAERLRIAPEDLSGIQGLAYQCGRSPLPHEQEVAAVAAHSFRAVNLAIG